LRRRALTAAALAGHLRAVCGDEWLAERAAETGRALRADRLRRADPVDAIL
jgi:hypothetical protein